MNIDTLVREIVRTELADLLPTMIPSPDEYLTTRQVAEMTGLSVAFFEIARSKESPDQPPYHRVGRRILYRRSTVKQWLDGRKRGGQE